VSTFDTGAAEDRSPWTRPAFVASAVLIVVIAILGLVLVLTGPGTAPSPAVPATPVPPQAPARSANSSACGLAPGDQSAPTVAPKVKWELVGRMAAPSAPKGAGPARSSDGFRTCFAHSPTGALYAAVNFWASLTAHPAAEVYRHLAADTPARSSAIKAASATAEELEARLQVAGFVISSYAAARSTIKLAFRLAQGRWVTIDSPMVWVDGDWRYDIPLDQGRASMSRIEDLGGFIQWSGV